MKVQFGAGRVRLRVSNAELAGLRAGDVLVAGIDWPDSAWRVEVAAADGFRVAGTPAAVRVELPRADVDALAGRAPARDGLRYVAALPSGPVALAFEVDLHDARRRPR